MTAPARPATIYTWDSNGTHIVAPTSGHQSNGYVNDEAPGSGETNGLLQNWWQELAYLDGAIHGSWIIPVPLNIVPISGTIAESNSGGKRYLTATSAGFSTFIYSLFGLTSGVTVVDVTLYYNRNSASITGSALPITLATGASTSGGGITDSSSTGDQTYSFATSGGLPNITFDGTQSLELNLTLAQNCRIYGASVTFTR